MALTLFNDADFFAPFFGPVHTSNGNRGQLERNHARPTFLDVSEKPKSFEVAADLPGLAKDDIKLHVEGDVLSIAVEKKAHKQDEVEARDGTKLHRLERSSAFMKRSLRMPESADMAKISARYQDGVLRLDIPKHEGNVERSRAIPIE